MRELRQRADDVVAAARLPVRLARVARQVQLAQLDVVKRCFDEDDGGAFGTLASSIEADASLKKYRERHFPDPGAWAALP